MVSKPDDLRLGCTVFRVREGGYFDAIRGAAIALAPCDVDYATALRDWLDRFIASADEGDDDETR